MVGFAMVGFTMAEFAVTEGHSCLRRNLEALSRYQPATATTIGSARPNPDLVPQTAGDGSPSVTAGAEKGRTLQLHSRYRPREEARRIVDSLEEAATLVVFGMGGAFVPREYLGRHRHAVVVVAETDISTLRAVLQITDVTAELESGRLRLAADSEDLVTQVTQVHQPLLRDHLITFNLTPWTDRDSCREQFSTLYRHLKRCLNHIAGEYHTMRHYGRPWFFHTLQNSLRLRWDTLPGHIAASREELLSRPVRIMAAGPSLDTFLQNDRGESDAHELVVDTALPAFAGRRRPFFGAVTLDPQGWSPLHFRTLPHRVTYLWADMGVSPSLHDKAHHVIPLASGHPLHRLLFSSGFPLLDLPGSRNVTEAALRLVQYLGGTVEAVVGADFSYPAGKTYARGTYHYTLADARAHRTHPAETFFAAQVYPNTTRITASRPVFRRTGMKEEADRFRHILHHPQSGSTYSEDRGPGPTHPDISVFWNHHREELNRLVRQITGFADRSTPEVLEQLGPHGRAHIPLLASVELSASVELLATAGLSPVGADSTLPLETRLAALFKKVGAIISEHNGF